MPIHPITDADVARELMRGFRPEHSFLSLPTILRLGEGTATPRGGEILFKFPRVDQTTRARIRSVYDIATFKVELVRDTRKEAETFAASRLEELRAKPRRWLRDWRTLWRGFCWRCGWRPELQEREGVRLRAAMVAQIGARVSADFERRIEEDMLGTYGGEAARRK